MTGLRFEAQIWSEKLLCHYICSIKYTKLINLDGSVNCLSPWSAYPYKKIIHEHIHLLKLAEAWNGSDKKEERQITLLTWQRRTVTSARRVDRGLRRTVTSIRVPTPPLGIPLWSVTSNGHRRQRGEERWGRAASQEESGGSAGGGKTR